MATVSTPVCAWVATLQSYTGVNQSASLTATCAVTAGWETRLQIQWSHQSAVSADGLVFVYASTDGGATYDSQPFASFSITRMLKDGQLNTAGNSFGFATIPLSTGIYCIQMLNSGPNSAFFGIPTAQVVTAFNNA